MATNRYILMAGNQYYPSTNAGDIVGCFPTLEDALAEWEKRQEKDNDDDWACIFDIDTMHVQTLKVWGYSRD
jgi:hypothetical protein